MELVEGMEIIMVDMVSVVDWEPMADMVSVVDLETGVPVDWEPMADMASVVDLETGVPVDWEPMEDMVSVVELTTDTGGMAVVYKHMFPLLLTLNDDANPIAKFINKL
jgi:hypothetical protein